MSLNIDVNVKIDFDSNDKIFVNCNPSHRSKMLSLYYQNTDELKHAPTPLQVDLSQRLDIYASRVLIKAKERQELR
jgi:hypothetical protein